METPSAPKTPASAAKPLPQPRGALVSLKITGSQAAKIGLLDRWVIGRKKTVSRQKSRSTASERLKRVTSQLMLHAAQSNLSQRQFEKRADLSWRTLHRCRDGQVNPRDWLPKLEAALARLKAS
jgi:hypothetical protein